VHDTSHGISTSGCLEEDHCLQVENLILQHVSPEKSNHYFHNTFRLINMEHRDIIRKSLAEHEHNLEIPFFEKGY
jgi:hypothetical protein